MSERERVSEKVLSRSSQLSGYQAPQWKDHSLLAKTTTLSLGAGAKHIELLASHTLLQMTLGASRDDIRDRVRGRERERRRRYGFKCIGVCVRLHASQPKQYYDDIL